MGKKKNFNQLYTDVELRTMPPKDVVAAYMALASEYTRLQQATVDLVNYHNLVTGTIVQKLRDAGQLELLKDMLSEEDYQTLLAMSKSED